MESSRSATRERGYGIASTFAGSDENEQLGMVGLNIRALVELTHVYWPRAMHSRMASHIALARRRARSRDLFPFELFSSHADHFP